RTPAKQRLPGVRRHAPRDGHERVEARSPQPTEFRCLWIETLTRAPPQVAPRRALEPRLLEHLRSLRIGEPDEAEHIARARQQFLLGQREHLYSELRRHQSGAARQPLARPTNERLDEVAH